MEELLDHGNHIANRSKVLDSSIAMVASTFMSRRKSLLLGFGYFVKHGIQVISNHFTNNGRLNLADELHESVTSIS
jgi:hypothetical protein